VPAAEDNVPTYQYACTACGHDFEAVQRFSDASLTDCPECAGRLRKVFSSVGIVFKGSGFYRTDSRSGSGEGGEKPAEKPGEKSGDKPAAESPGKDTAKKDAPKKDAAAKSANTGSSSGGSKAPAAAAS
jgi:putative FmdB family regulatory protein